MTSKKKTVKSEEIVEQDPVIINENDIIPEEKAKTLKSDEITDVKAPKVVIEKAKMPKYAVGSIVYVSKDADADLNGFKLFPQYKIYVVFLQ